MRKNEAKNVVCRIKSTTTCWKAIFATVAVALTFSSSFARAGTEMQEVTPPTVGTKEEAKDWTAEWGTGVAFSNVRVGEPNQPYTLVPVTFCASLKVDDVSLDNFVNGWFRGYTEFFFRGDYDFIPHGPEHYYSGIFVGPRYNFVQPGWKLVPYLGAGVGFGFADSNPEQRGLGQDFNFSFEAEAGVKYNLTNDMFLRLGIQYQHISNAGLSHPVPNNQIDALGPKLSVGFAF